MIFDSKKRKGRRAIRGAAEHYGIPEQECRNEMQAALDEAWASSQSNPETMALWAEYFPDGKKPSLEDFIARMADEVRRQSRSH